MPVSLPLYVYGGMRYHKVAQFHHNQREMAAILVLSRKLPTFASIFFQTLTRNPSIHRISFLNLKPYTPPKPSTVFVAQFHDGRPRGPLWRGKKLIGKEALFVIMGLKRQKIDDEKLKRLKQTTDYCIRNSLRREKKTWKRRSSFCETPSTM